MTEWLFPIAGALLLFFVAVPLLSLLARALCTSMPQAGSILLAHVSPWRFIAITGPTLGPLVWFISAAVHQSEAGAPLTICLMEHLGGDVCRDVILFGALLLLVLGAGAARRAGRSRRGPAAAPASPEQARVRVRRLCAATPTLAPLRGRVVVVGEGLAPACTRGLWRPRVEVEASLVEGLSDAELVATFLHELEHLSARDPLRFFVAHVALSVNPAAGLLAPELARYHLAREVLCDRRAVQRGADPLALASSIVVAASPIMHHVAALGGTQGMDAVHLRVQLLLSYAEGCPTRPAAIVPFGLAPALLAVLAILPHILGTAPLDGLHVGVERFALLVGLGG